MNLRVSSCGSFYGLGFVACSNLKLTSETVGPFR